MSCYVKFYDNDNLRSSDENDLNEVIRYCLLYMFEGMLYVNRIMSCFFVMSYCI